MLRVSVEEFTLHFSQDSAATVVKRAERQVRRYVVFLPIHSLTGTPMCRWIAYRGETTSFEPYVTEPEHSLIAQSIRSLQSTAGSNGDGFGLGWYGEHPEPGLYRETRPAWSDENLRYLCRHLRSHLFFAHVRAATGTPVTRQNCHPFACGRWMFMHNGFVGSWSRLRRKVEALIPDAYYPSRSGTTDSEAVFLAMMGAGLDDDPVGATHRVMRSLFALVNQANCASGCASPARLPMDAISMRFGLLRTTARTRFISGRPAGK